MATITTNGFTGYTVGPIDGQCFTGGDGADPLWSGTGSGLGDPEVIADPTGSGRGHVLKVYAGSIASAANYDLGTVTDFSTAAIVSFDVYASSLTPLGWPSQGWKLLIGDVHPCTIFFNVGNEYVSFVNPSSVTVPLLADAWATVTVAYDATAGTCTLTVNGSAITVSQGAGGTVGSLTLSMGNSILDDSVLYDNLTVATGAAEPVVDTLPYPSYYVEHDFRPRCSLCGQRLVEGERERCNRLRCLDLPVPASIGIVCVFGGEGPVATPIIGTVAIVGVAVVGTDYVE